jgi:20S proteasome subunit beta 2
MDLPTKGGFDFGLCRRNQSLAEKKGLKIPGFLKTGTTIVGLVFKVWLISSLLLSRVQ